MIKSLRLKVFPEDKVETFPDPALGLGSRITIIRATKINVTDARVQKVYRTWEATIKDLLKEQKIELLGQDSSNPDINSRLINNMNITITRVAEVEVKETRPIEYSTIKKTSVDIEKGNSEIERKGINGEKEITYLIRRVDGVEVSKTVKDTNITKESQNEIIVVGTKVVVYGAGKATWYGRNATMVAASNTIPKGTTVKVVAVNSGKSVIVEIDDAGIQSDAIIDLSDDAFEALAPLGAGIISVRVEKYYP